MEDMILKGLGHIVKVYFYIASSWSGTPQVDRALIYGSDTKAIFHVVDDEGDPVEGAMIRVTYVMNGEKSNGLREGTDENGVLITQDQSVGEVIYFISKKGSYETHGRINFRNRLDLGELCKRWQVAALWQDLQGRPQAD